MRVVRQRIHLRRDLKGCWCMNLKLTDDARNELKSKFNDCLCQQCLEKLAV